MTLRESRTQPGPGHCYLRSSVLMDLDFVSVHKHAKKELGQYPAILTSRLANNPHIFCKFVRSPNKPDEGWYWPAEYR